MSGKSRRFVHHATDVKNGNAGRKLHCSLWEKSGLLDLTRDLYCLAENKGHGEDVWDKQKLFLAYCL